MEPIANMASLKSPCSGAAIQDDDDFTTATASGAQTEGSEVARKRRHSHFIPRRKSIVNQIMDGEEHLLLKVCSLAITNVLFVHGCVSLFTEAL